MPKARNIGTSRYKHNTRFSNFIFNMESSRLEFFQPGSTTQDL